MWLIGNILGFIGYYNHAKGRIEQAYSFYQKALSAQMSNKKYRLAFAILLLNKGEYYRSKELLNGLIIQLKDKERMYLMVKTNLALANWKMGDINTAIEMLWEVHQKARRAIVYGALGYLLILKGELEAAFEFNQNAIEYDPEDPVILNNLAQVYYRMGSLEEAKKYFLKAEKIKDNLIEVLYYLACIEQQQGEIEQAKTRLNRALQCKPAVLTVITKDDIYEKIKELG